MRRVIALASIVFVAGCGASAQQEVAAVIRATDAAWERGDVEDACSRMTKRAQQQYIEAGIDPHARTCTAAYDSDPVQESTEMLVQTLVVTEIEAPRITSIRVSGDRAVAIYSYGDPTRLRKIKGRWLIDSF
jgi:hypothetical protein